MSSSRNYFDPLAEGSSSKEQETRVPTTDTTDHVMYDAPQTGPSAGNEPISATSLGASVPKRLSREEGIALFHKRRVEWEKEEKEERKQKLRKGKSSTFVSQPIPSAAPPQGLRKRRASPNEAKESSKRRRVEPLSSSQVAEEPATAAPASVLAGNSSAPTVVVQEDPVLSPWNSFTWANLQTPKKSFMCVVQVNDSTRIGSFDRDTTNWAFELTLNPADAERRWVPTMTMKFFCNGVKGRQSAQTRWSLREWMEDDYMVTGFKIHRVADCAENGSIRHHDILAACKTDDAFSRLICIDLEAWPKILNHFDMCDTWDTEVKELLSAVLTGRRPHHLRIWFLAPYRVGRFNKKCLSFFTRYFGRRDLLQGGVYRNASGVSYEEYLRAQENTSR